MKKFAFITGEQPMKGSKKVWFQYSSADAVGGAESKWNFTGVVSSLIMPSSTDAKEQLEKNGYVVVSSRQEMLKGAEEALMTNPDRQEVEEKRRRRLGLPPEHEVW